MTFLKMGYCFLGSKSASTSADLQKISKMWKTYGEFSARWQQVFLVSMPLKCLSLQAEGGSLWQGSGGSFGADRSSGFWESLLTFAHSILLHWCKQLEQWLPYIFVIALECCGFDLLLSQWHCLLWLFTVDQDWCSFSCSVSSTFLRLCARPRKYIPSRSLQSQYCFLITFKTLLYLLSWNTHKTQLTILKCIFQWYVLTSCEACSPLQFQNDVFP